MKTQPPNDFMAVMALPKVTTVPFATNLFVVFT
jgi:hypothetical protein